MYIYQLKNCRTQCTKLPLLLFVGFERSHDRPSYPHFSFLKMLIFRLELVTCYFWWKALTIAPRPNLYLPIKEKRDIVIFLYICNGCPTCVSSEEEIIIGWLKHYVLSVYLMLELRSNYLERSLFICLSKINSHSGKEFRKSWANHVNYGWCVIMTSRKLL